MLYLPKVKPAGLLVLEPEELASIQEDLLAGPELLILAFAALIRELVSSR